MKQKLFIAIVILGIAKDLSAQNVGIGTATPLQKLQVQGNTSIKDSLGIGMDTATEKLDVAGNVKFRNNAFISGSVGIGTIAPANRLHLYSSLPGQYLAKFESNGGFGEINITNGTTTGDVGVFTGAMYMGTLSAGDVMFRTNAIERMRIQDGTGNVGIGTSTPGARLSLGTSYPNQRLLSFLDLYVTNNAYGIGMEANPASAGSRLMIYSSNAQPTNAVAFGSYSGTTFTETMRAQANGNVGIGTTTPAQRLDVSGNANITGKIIASDSALLNANAKISGNAIINGNVGIGTNTPSQKIDVIGNANITGKLIVSDSALLNGNAKVAGKLNVIDTAFVGAIAVENWQTLTLQSSWGNQGGGYATAACFKDKQGMVHLRGRITGGTTAGATLLFTLPVGYRPSTSGILTTEVNNSFNAALIDIYPNGNVLFYPAAIFNNGFILLNSVTFRAD